MAAIESVGEETDSSATSRINIEKRPTTGGGWNWSPSPPYRTAKNWFYCSLGPLRVEFVKTASNGKANGVGTFKLLRSFRNARL